VIPAYNLRHKIIEFALEFVRDQSVTVRTKREQTRGP
jgi:hypothetical protein